MYCKHILLFISLGLSVSVDATAQLLVPLPQEQAEAALRLADGTIDSSLWHRVEPFYAQPIRIPQGEIRILHELFPELSGRLPSKGATLRKYEPWGAENVDNFLEDFPVLVALRPILDFQTSRLPHVARLGVALRSGYPDGAAGQLMHLSAGDGSSLVLDARADVSHQHARWRRRMVSYRIRDDLRVSLGNGTFIPDLRAYGYYASSAASDTLLWQNWLHGSAGAWNGVVAELEPQREYRSLAVTGNAFAHSRPTEQILGGTAGLQLRGASLSFGGSRLIADEDSVDKVSDTAYYCSGEVAVEKGGWTVRLGSTYDVRAARLPLQICGSYRDQGTSYVLNMLYFPQLFEGPRSALLRKYISSPSCGETDLAVVVVNTESHVSENVAISQEFSGTMQSGCAKRVSGALSAWGGETQCIRVGYRLSVMDLAADDSADHEIFLKADTRLAEISAQISNTVSYSRQQVRFRGSFDPVWQATPAISIAPHLRYYLRHGARWDFYAGLKQRMELFSKTYTEVSVGRVMHLPWREGLNVQVRSWFYL